MTHAAETKNMALFCDFENVALGARDANHAQFDISKVMERLLLKGSIVVKKAYCDRGAATPVADFVFKACDIADIGH